MIRSTSVDREIADERLAFESLDPVFAQAPSVFRFECFLNFSANLVQCLVVRWAELLNFDQVAPVVPLQNVARLAGFEREIIRLGSVAGRTTTPIPEGKTFTDWRSTSRQIRKPQTQLKGIR